MRTIAETHQVPATEVQTVTYGCDECDFTSDFEEEVKKHWARQHACRQEMDVASMTMRRFDTEEAARAWLDDDEWHRVRELEWGGAGWYLTETWTQPCPKGCCRDSCIRLFPASTFCGERIEKARSIMRTVADVRRALRG